MKLQHQVLAFIVLTSLVAIVTTYSIIKNNIDSDFSHFEQEQILEDVNRLNNTIEYDISQLEKMTGDWAVWDDSYLFTESLNKGYILSNLTAETFKNIEVDYFAYIDSNASVIYGKTFNVNNDALEEFSASETRDISKLAAFHILHNNPLPKNSLVLIGNSPCFFSLKEIRKSDNSGEKNHAFLLFASRIDNNYIEKLSLITQTNISIYNKAMPVSHIDIVDNDLIKGVITLNNYNNQPLINLSVDNQRSIYQYGKTITRKFIIILPIICILIGIIANFTMNKLVIKRIAKLRKHIQEFTNNPSKPNPIHIHGNSEISDLAKDFNYMINTITKIQHDLNQALSIAHKATQSKSDFIANMSHEIRTPMTAILGYNNLLKGDISKEERDSYISTIEKNGEQLLCIINEILDISKIEANELSINMQKTELSPLLQEVCALMKLSAVEKGLTFNVRSLTDIPEWIETDASRLKQVLINLIGNAIKFTPQGAVSILIEQSINHKNVTISVQDTGIGLDQDSIDNIFKPFYQVESSMTRKFQGTGLGLTIAKDLTEKLGGELSITSQPEKGTTFSIILPINQAVPVTNLIEETCSPGVVHFSPEKKLQGNIFVIDDNPVILMLISKMLTNFGLNVHSESDSKVAISKLLDGNHQTDIVFMDMQMPVIDGYSATRYLNTNGFIKPIVAITANTMEGDREKCLFAGCSEFLSKPIDPQKLYETCERFLA